MWVLGPANVPQNRNQKEHHEFVKLLQRSVRINLKISTRKVKRCSHKEQNDETWVTNSKPDSFLQVRFSWLVQEILINSIAGFPVLDNKYEMRKDGHHCNGDVPPNKLPFLSPSLEMVETTRKHVLTKVCLSLENAACCHTVTAVSGGHMGLLHIDRYVTSLVCPPYCSESFHCSICSAIPHMHPTHLNCKYSSFRRSSVHAQCSWRGWLWETRPNRIWIT